MQGGYEVFELYKMEFPLRERLSNMLNLIIGYVDENYMKGKEIR